MSKNEVQRMQPHEEKRGCFVRKILIMLLLVLMLFLTLVSSLQAATYNDNDQLKIAVIINSLESKKTNNEQAKKDIENLKSYYLRKIPFIRNAAHEGIVINNADGSAPVLVSTNVPKWSINIPTNITISLTFDKPIKFGNKKIQIYDWDTFDDIQIDTHIDGNTLFIDPVNNFSSYSKYMLDLDDAAISSLDGFGNESIYYSFCTCGCPDCIGSPPELLSMNVPEWSINVPIDTTFSFTFNKTIIKGNDKIQIYDWDTFEDVQISTTITNNTLYINPTDNLQPYTKYMLVIEDEAISDLNCVGNEELFYSFTTCGCELCSGEAPYLVSTNVPEWSINIPINTTLTLSFDKPIMIGNSKVEIYNFDTYDNINIDLSINGSTLFINPSNNLDIFTKYILDIDDAAISDLNCIGNEEILYSFTTSENKFGDMNTDGSVNILDLLNMAQYIGSKPTDPIWTVAQKADVNKDEMVNILDLLMTAQYIGS